MNNDNIFSAYNELLIDDFFEMSILANTSAFLNQFLDNINWIGFYILKNNSLYLGPFQGRVACTKIEVGKGVCGNAVLGKNTIIVDDVHLYPSHIACDEASNSEIVIPIFINNQVYGVLDIDSPLKGRFTIKEKIFLENIVGILESHLTKIYF